MTTVDPLNTPPLDALHQGRPLQALLTHRAAQKNVDHYYAGVEVAWDAKRTLAHTVDAATASPRLVAHSRRMAQRIYRVAERVYCAVGYALANVIVVVGDGGFGGRRCVRLSGRCRKRCGCGCA